MYRKVKYRLVGEGRLGEGRTITSVSRRDACAGEAIRQISLKGNTEEGWVKLAESITKNNSSEEKKKRAVMKAAGQDQRSSKSLNASGRKESLCQRWAPP